MQEETERPVSESQQLTADQGHLLIIILILYATVSVSFSRLVIPSSCVAFVDIGEIPSAHGLVEHHAPIDNLGGHGDLAQVRPVLLRLDADARQAQRGVHLEVYHEPHQRPEQQREEEVGRYPRESPISKRRPEQAPRDDGEHVRPRHEARDGHDVDHRDNQRREGVLVVRDEYRHHHEEAPDGSGHPGDVPRGDDQVGEPLEGRVQLRDDLHQGAHQQDVARGEEQEEVDALCELE
mmetsp:Transcript_2384/g.4504  ORF Transcript_2384/g.4504 Transcript_2384/m.4504 type:complete len:237 (+) Transcript_2384:66-776(+)